MRLDQAIAVRFPDVSRRQARRLISDHRVLVNDRAVSIASREIEDTDRIRIAELIGGRPARTVVRPLSNGLVEAAPETGRTHQIRMHLASIGRPVVGDRRYGGSKQNG